MIVTLEQVLQHGHGTWRSFTCPNHDDVNPSARVNIVSGKWICMVCGSKGTTKGYVPDVNLMLEDALAGLDDESLVKTERWLDQFDHGPVPQYWLSRFSEPICRIFRLGWDGNVGMPCYPIRDVHGRPLGVTHRNIDDPGGPKYKYPKGIKTSDLLFGLHEARQTSKIFLVEGAPDVCAVRETSYDALGIYGSHISEAQVRQIAAVSPDEVILAFDMDKAGHIGSGRAEAMLNAAGVLTRRGFWSAQWKDLSDMDLQERSHTLENLLAYRSTKG